MQPLSGLAISLFPSWLPVYELVLLIAIVVSLYVARRIGASDSDSDSDSDIGRIVRARFLWGIPWGTLLITVFVLCVYLFVQDGFTHPTAPTVIPFRAWSYFYPTGILTSPLAHASRGHLTSNLTGTLTVGVLAEYVWGHYPTRQETETETETGTGIGTSLIPITNPYARVLAFVFGSLVVGLVTGVFSLGPAIGFSGVVFAYAGFTLTRYPFGTTLVLLSGRVLSLIYRSFRNPTLTQSGHPQFVTPWWAGISLQGHALGLFVGALCGAYLVRRRSIRPDGFRLWSGILLFAVFEGLWAVYIPLGGARFKLFRAGGAVLVLLLAILLASAVRSTNEPFLGRFDIQYKQAAMGLTVAVLVVLAAVAVPYNVFLISDQTPGITQQNSVQVRGYTIAYAEGIPDQYISNIQLSVLGETTDVRANGVIVVNDQREIWWQEVSKGRLAFDRQVNIRVGGIGWRETVLVRRTTWKVVGNHSVYTVHLKHDDERVLAFTSKPARAQPTIDGRNVTIIPGETFAIQVSHNGTTLGQAPIPKRNEAVSVGGLTFVRRKNEVYATNNETRVRVAKYASSS